MKWERDDVRGEKYIYGINVEETLTFLTFELRTMVTFLKLFNGHFCIFVFYLHVYPLMT